MQHPPNHGRQGEGRVKGELVKMKRLIIVLACFALVGAACGGDDEGSDGATGDGGGSESVTLTASDFAFQPESLSVASGGTIEFTNEDDAEHNITAEDAGVDEDVDPNGSVTVDLADVEPGSYEFICEYHPDSMTGTLEVTE